MIMFVCRTTGRTINTSLQAHTLLMSADDQKYHVQKYHVTVKLNNKIINAYVDFRGAYNKIQLPKQ